MMCRRALCGLFLVLLSLPLSAELSYVHNEGETKYAASDTVSPAELATDALTLSPGQKRRTALEVTADTLPGASANQSYSASLRATGGIEPYTWSIASGQLPDGLSISPSTGVISGTPTTNNTFDFVVMVTDSSTPAQTASASTSILVAPHPLTIVTSALASGSSGTAYTQALLASGGAPPYTWSFISASIPAGLTLAPTTGVLSGTPTASGIFPFSVKVSDKGSPAQSAISTFNLLIDPPTAASLVMNPINLPAATTTQPYSGSLSATGGTAPYTWSITSGQLPPGLSISPSTGTITGAISGTPTASNAFAFAVMVTDASSPAQTASGSASILVGPQPLTITTSALPSGSSGTAYSQPLQARGGTPAYTWSIASGSLPSGLTLAATTGVISGTPTATGTSSFTAAVSDTGSPVQTVSAATSIAVAATPPPAGPGTTWYIRADGGTRYSANMTSGQCDGQADVAYPGSGTNQHCAFKDYRYLWDDQSYANDAWVIAGGDTVIIRGGPWRVGFDSNTGAGAGWTWCFGGQGSFACINPTIPAGTAAQHTRILGENYGSCSAGNAVDKSKLTQIFGGFGAWSALNLAGTKYVDVQCLEITSHSQCITHGSPAVPKACSSRTPVDDYDSEGVNTDVGTHDILMQDLYIHGNTDRGVKGAIGGIVTCLRCDIAYNGMAGWDFDDGTGSNGGNGTASLPAAVWNFNYSTIEWNGCNQIYPGTGADTCYSQSSGGYGDGVGTPPGMCITANIDHSAFNYNTQDGLDLGHGDTGSCPLTITNSIAIGNSGGTFKAGPNEAPFVFMNNIVEANCFRLAHPMAGASSYFNANLSDFCRAGDAMSFNFRPGGTAVLADNTIVSYAPTSYDIACWGAIPCANSTLTFENNITIGYDNPATYNQGGQTGGTGGIYYQEPIGTVTRRNNIWYGMRSTSFSCPTGNPGEICTNPLLRNQPARQGANFVDTELDNFDFSLSPGSPAIGAGLTLPDVPSDYTGAQRADPPSIGAYEK